MFDGYEKAMEIDKSVNESLEADPITPANAREWLKFARTLKTTADILERMAWNNMSLQKAVDLLLSDYEVCHSELEELKQKHKKLQEHWASLDSYVKRILQKMKGE